MKGFVFSLKDTTDLREEPDGYYLLSRLPLRLLRLNRPLYRLLEHLRDGGGLGEYLRRNPELDEGYLLPTLLSLTSRGYLSLDGIAEVEDYLTVSVIIPVRDQPEDLADCLQSLERLDYPEDRLEIIVVDDASRHELSRLVASAGVRVIRQAEPRGAAAGRNTGAENARGDVLAFLDADCMAREDWLRELVPFFRAASVGAIGGYVDGYYRKSLLDRYEEVSSPLNMGKRVLLEGKGEPTFYVPTANMLVSREAFKAVGGFREGMHVGEDVDFCWRMRELGYTLLYVPYGRVAHRHRNRLWRMLKRRSQYGTSEAGLYRSHRGKRKMFLVSVYTGLSFLALTLAVLLMNPYPLGAVALLFGFDLWRKSATLKKLDMATPCHELVNSALRNHLAFYYFGLFHLVRYYLVPIFAIGFWLHSLWLFGGLAILATSMVDFFVRRPNILYPFFLFFYVSEHVAYQLGVFWGCLKLGYFWSYALSFRTPVGYLMKRR